MIIGSQNIKGGGSKLKRRRICSIIWKGKADIFLIQETKISNMEDFIARSFWDEFGIGFSFSNPVSLLGGTIILWEDTLSVLFSFKGDSFLGIRVMWKYQVYYIVNVYSSCDFLAKN